MVDVTKEECASQCEDLLGCDVYTYHFGNSTTFPNTCFFLTELLKPISTCEDRSCLSMSPDCNLDCGFRVDGVLYPTSIVVTETGATDIDVISNGVCGTLLAVAVGGGGYSVGDAGSGSGYVEYTEINITSTLQIRAEVGGSERVTELTDLLDGSTLLTADYGKTGVGYDGGDGFSGGGADYRSDGSGGFGGDGGQDGEDGEDTNSATNGGKGSGLDISSIPLRNVVIR